METKYSVSLHSLKCRTCLSVGRRLSPLAPYCDVLRCVVGSSHMLYTSQMLICWECEAVLRSVLRFRNRVFTANSVLSQTHQAPLSTLAITMLEPVTSSEESNTIQLKQEDEIIENTKEAMTDDKYDAPFVNADVKWEDLILVSETKVKIHLDDFEDNELALVEPDRQTEHKDKDNKEIIGSDTIEVTTNNLICMPKKTLAKKSFKYIKMTGSTKVKQMYLKVAINETEIAECLAKERDSVFFKQSKYKCEKCVAVFRTDSQQQKHMKLHMNAAGNNLCDVCGMRFPSRALLAPHRESHRHNLACRACSYESYTSSHMSQHYRKHHDTTYQCRKCRLQFASKSAFDDHYRELHKWFVCDHCATKFLTRDLLLRHMSTQHTRFRCSVCAASYSSRACLRAHTLRRHARAPPGAEPYCVECDMQFPNEFRYQCHLKTSFKHKPRIKRFPCSECGLSFSKRGQLSTHRDLVHLRLRRFRCEHCGQMFGKKCNLVEHRRARHERRAPSESEHVCRVCARGFTAKHSLIRHMLIHTGERPYVCLHCSATFTQRSAMNTHVRNQHSMPPPQPPT